MDWASFSGAILGGLIAAVASLYISKRTIKADLKKTKNEITAKFNIEVTAQSKQEWIDDLRKNIAELIATLFKINLYFVDFKKDTSETLNGFSDLVQRFYFRKSYIELMLTGKDTEFDQLICKLNDVSFKINYTAIALGDLFSPSSDFDEARFANYQMKKNKLMKEILNIMDDIVVISKKILKNEYTSKENLRIK